MRSLIQSHIEASILTKRLVLERSLADIQKAADLVAEAVHKGKKVLFFGNGGSASDAQHFAAEFVGRYNRERKALPALALTTDSSVLTCLANDYGYKFVFSRQIEALGQPGDVAVAISTSGNSENVLLGVESARRMGLKTIIMTGKEGGQLKGKGDVCIMVPSNVTAHIQEAHGMIGHILCACADKQIP